MGNRVVIYKQKVEDNLKESYKHLDRLDGAFAELSNSFKFPIDKHSFEEMTSSTQSLAYRDQIIYRFSKLQDCMGAKLFKLVLLSQGENVNKPFLDILNQLEKINIIDVDEWFEIRDLRNEIAYDYEDNDLEAIEILNTIYKLKGEE
jgi:uncharacterized protein YkuJ